MQTCKYLLTLCLFCLIVLGLLNAGIKLFNPKQPNQSNEITASCNCCECVQCECTDNNCKCGKKATSFKKTEEIDKVTEKDIRPMTWMEWQAERLKLNIEPFASN
jgi:hypothetical protein